MKAIIGYRFGVTLTLFFLTAAAYRDVENSDIFDSGYSGNCSNGNCDDSEDEDSKCPPDSSLDPTDGSCYCSIAHCYQPNCRPSEQLVLRRKGNNVPGDCCDVYQCLSEHEKNCSGVVCPAEAEKCPEDSYRLPSYKSPEDCCSTQQSCQCLPRECEERVCPNGQYPRIVRQGNKKPGTCCPLYDCVLEQKVNDSCLLDDSRLMSNGSTWQKDQCTICSCINGYQYCRSSDASICYEKKGCISSSGNLYDNGETWEDDACTKCRCESGEKKCVAYMCEVSCTNPRYVPGECCPICDDSTIVRSPPHCPNLNCSLRCLHGFVRDKAGCITCECEAGPCLLECANGFAHDSRGHLLCECAEAKSPSSSDCPTAMQCRKYCAHGPNFDRESCNLCACRNNSCEPLENCEKFCPIGYAFNEKGCPICKCLDIDPVGALSNANAKRCITSDGGVRVHGETWHDECRQCLCHEGIEMCNLILCPRLNCVNPIFNSSRDCCATCPDDALKEVTDVKAVLCHSFDGTYKKDGEIWSVNRCTKCICHNGQTLCDTRQCPPTPCPFPVMDEDQCCARCPEIDRTPKSQGWHCGFAHPHGSVWRRSNCESCRCVNGREVCFTEQCNREKCAHPVLQKNQCCGICVENIIGDACYIGNRTRENFEEWMEGDCTRCICRNGQSMCTKEVCTPPNCDNPIKKPGSCCRFCPGRGIDGRAGDEEAHGFTKSPVKIFVYYIIITVLVLVIVSLLASILILCKRSRRYCVSCPDSESLPSFKTLSKPKFKYNSSDSDYTTEKEKFAIV